MDPNNRKRSRKSKLVLRQVAELDEELQKILDISQDIQKPEENYLTDLKSEYDSTQEDSPEIENNEEFNESEKINKLNNEILESLEEEKVEMVKVGQSLLKPLKMPRLMQMKADSNDSDDVIYTSDGNCDHTYSKPQSSPTNIQFSINIEVEEFDDENINTDSLNIDESCDYGYRTNTEISVRKDLFIDPGKDAKELNLPHHVVNNIILGQEYCQPRIEALPPHIINSIILGDDFQNEDTNNVSKEPTQIIEPPVLIDDATIYKEKSTIIEDREKFFDELYENVIQMQSPADLFMRTYILNNFGDCMPNDQTRNEIDQLIQEALETWVIWFRITKQLPMLYKCYICDIAWWHLNDLRQHLIDAKHEFKIHMEVNDVYSNIVAFAKSLPKAPAIKEIPIQGKCWKCFRKYDEHKNLICTCQVKFSSCSYYIAHLSICDVYNKEQQSKLKDVIVLSCNICDLKFYYLHEYNEHFLLTHDVRSDVPTPKNNKIIPPKCKECGRHIKISEKHCCPAYRMQRRSNCQQCYTKFYNNLALQIHIRNNVCVASCPVCKLRIPMYCMVPDHMIKHTDKYMQVFRCDLCDDVVLFVNVSSFSDHMIAVHDKQQRDVNKYERKMYLPSNLFYKYYCKIHYTIDKQHNVVARTKEKLNIGTEEHANNKQSASFLITPATFITFDANAEVPQIHTPKPKKNKKRKPVLKIPKSKITIKRSRPEKASKSNKETINITNNKNNPEPEIKEVDITGIEVDVKCEAEDEIDVADNEFNESDDNIDTDPEYTPSGRKRKATNKKHKKDDAKDNTISKAKDITPVKEKKDTKVAYEELLTTILGDGELDGENGEELDMVKVKTEIKEEPFDYDLFTGSIGMNFFDEAGVTQQQQPLAETLEPEIIMGEMILKRTYCCKTCGFIGYYREYKDHIESKICKKLKINLNAERQNIIYLCTKCCEEFVTFKLYLAHFSVHGFRIKTCPECLENFKTYGKLSMHLQMHIKELYQRLIFLTDDQMKQNFCYQCRKCKLRITENDFFEHWESHLEFNLKHEVSVEQSQMEVDRSSEMEIEAVGNDAFPSVELIDAANMKLIVEQLQKHNRQYDRSTDCLNCILCPKKFSRKTDHKRHIIEHLLMEAYGNKPRNGGFKCQVCSEITFKPDEYKQHMRNHASLPIYRCELCNKSFSDSSNFAKHKKVHNVKVLVCDHCGKKFHKKITLEAHLKLHDRESIKCPICPMEFVCVSKKNKHIKRVHDNIRPTFRCMICRTSFSTLKAKWDHQWDVHRERNTKADCPECGQKFRKYSDVKRHVSEVHCLQTVFVYSDQTESEVEVQITVE